ncbi:MAG: nucleotide exchange factor GrpE [Planctomycetaceae bacterium]|jgi:molecular chaperone GrpE (heat shock protein)|nr:nucleotide exchange factor GrpE [Planctomycetaceae bacterium]
MSNIFDKHRTSFDQLMNFSPDSELLKKNEVVTQSIELDNEEKNVQAEGWRTRAELDNDDEYESDVDVTENDEDGDEDNVKDEYDEDDDNVDEDEVEEDVELVDGVDPIESTITQLSRQNSAVLERFTQWLYSSGDETFDSDELSGTLSGGVGDISDVGIFQVFEVLSAQRQELKLYAKSGRKTVELIEKSIAETSRVVEQFARFKRERPDIERRAIKPFIASLVEIDESLLRAVSFLDAVQNRLILHSHNIDIYAGAYCDQFSIFQRFWRRKMIFQFTEYLKKERIAEVEHILQPLQDGFKMVLFRMEDVLRRHSVARLNPIGELVNPETMHVVAILDSTDVDAGCVVDVVRPGYMWCGRPFRFADVRAARAPNN